jgi:hypothetical protein
VIWNIGRIIYQMEEKEKIMEHNGQCGLVGPWYSLVKRAIGIWTTHFFAWEKEEKRKGNQTGGNHR